MEIFGLALNITLADDTRNCIATEVRNKTFEARRLQLEIFMWWIIIASNLEPLHQLRTRQKPVSLAEEWRSL